MCLGIPRHILDRKMGSQGKKKEKEAGQYRTEFLIFPLEKFGFDVPQF